MPLCPVTLRYPARLNFNTSFRILFLTQTFLDSSLFHYAFCWKWRRQPYRRFQRNPNKTCCQLFQATVQHTPGLIFGISRARQMRSTKNSRASKSPETSTWLSLAWPNTRFRCHSIFMGWEDLTPMPKNRDYNGASQAAGLVLACYMIQCKRVADFGYWDGRWWTSPKTPGRCSLVVWEFKNDTHIVIVLAVRKSTRTIIVEKWQLAPRPASDTLRDLLLWYYRF